MNKSFSHISGLLRTVAAAAIALGLTACAEEPLTPETETGLQEGTFGFFVATSNEWNSANSNSDDDITSLSIIPVEGGNPEDSLFLHVTVSDGIDGAALSGEATRSTQINSVSEFYDSFGVSAAVFPSSESWDASKYAANYLYNLEVTKDNNWTITEDYYWPGSLNKIRFFAYAPYNGDETSIELSAASTVGAPVITYTVPTAVADQKDLLVAVTDDLSGSATSANLEFDHALTAVKFSTGDNVLAGKVKSVTLIGVYSEGTYTIGSSSWTGSATGDFTYEFSDGLQLSGDADESIIDGEATFLMIPGTVPSDATVEIVYTDDFSDTQRTLTADIEGHEWPMGGTVEYKISTESIVITPYFSVTPASFTFRGGADTYTVTSCYEVTRSGDETKYVGEIPWTATFIDEDGNEMEQPSWVKSLVTSGEGSNTASSYTVELKPQSGYTTSPNANNSDIQSKDTLGTPSDPLDLSYYYAGEVATTMNTANCYVINGSGYYKIPLVYGNAITDGDDNEAAYTYTSTSTTNSSYVLKNFVNHLGNAITDPYIYKNTGCTPCDAVLIWQDEPNMYSNVSLTEDGKYIYFEAGIESEPRESNAMIAVRDADGTIMWSWHIWMSRFAPGRSATTETTATSSSYRDKEIKIQVNSADYSCTMMGVDVGFCLGETTTYDARDFTVRFTQEKVDNPQTYDVTFTQSSGSVTTTINQTYYQWGRKDPMPPFNHTISSSSDKYLYTEDAPYTYISSEGPTTIQNAIQNPDVFIGISGGGEWCSSQYMNLWSANNNTFATVGNNTVSNYISLSITKTVYDPCPVGYHVPTGGIYKVYTYDGTTSANGWKTYFNSTYTSVSDYTSTNFGMRVYCYYKKSQWRLTSSFQTGGGSIFFPITGNRSGSAGTAGNPRWVIHYGVNVSLQNGLLSPCVPSIMSSSSSYLQLQPKCYFTDSPSPATGQAIRGQAGNLEAE